LDLSILNLLCNAHLTLPQKLKKMLGEIFFNAEIDKIILLDPNSQHNHFSFIHFTEKINAEILFYWIKFPALCREHLWQNLSVKSLQRLTSAR